MRHPTLTSLLASVALVLGGCVADATSSRVGLGEDWVDPTGPAGPRDDFHAAFDAGAPDAASGLHDIPGRDDDRSSVDDSSHRSPEDALTMRCGTEWCGEGYVCCPATQRCVPETCPGCCSDDDFHRFDPIEAMDPEEYPDIDPAGPRPGEDDGADDAPPFTPPSDADPGPMPVGPGAPDDRWSQ